MSLLERLCGSAEQPACARSFTSLSVVSGWLETLPDVEGSGQLQKIKAALPVLENPKGKRDLLHMMCDQWGQEQWRNNKPLPAPVLAQELTAKVLAASNVALRRWEKSGSAAQPVAPSDVAQLAHDDEMPNAAPSSAAEPAAASSAAHRSHDDHASSECTSLAVVEEWLESLHDIAEKEEVRKIHLALEFLNKPAKRRIKNICAVWPEQKQKKTESY